MIMPGRPLADYYRAEFSIEDQVKSNRCPIKYAINFTIPPMPRPVEPLKFSSEIIEYKSFLREIMKYLSWKKTIRKGYDAIESNAIVNSAYSVADFAMEANSLEKQFHELNGKVDFLPFYETFMERLDEYGKSREKNISAVDKKMLALIYATILSKTMCLRSSQKSISFIDIDTSFESIIQEVKELNETSRIRMVNQQRQRYNEDIIAKIDETNDYIVNAVQPEIQKLFSTLDNDYEIDEPRELPADAIGELTMREGNPKIIGKSVCTRIVTSLLKAVVESLPLLGTVLKFTARAADVISTQSHDGPEIKDSVEPAELRSGLNEFEFAKSDEEQFDAIKKELRELIEFLKITKEDNHKFDDKLNRLMWKEKSKHSIINDDVEQQFRAFNDLVGEQEKKLVAIEKVRNNLHSVRRELIGSIGGLGKANGVEKCLVRIDEAITLIIHIYDRIQEYQEQAKLVLYMSGLHLKIVDQQLEKDLNQLQFNLQANLILTQYIRAVDGFKQAVFPFAAHYVDIYELPATSGENMDSIVANAVDKIKSLSVRINQLNSKSINDNIEQSINTASFDRSDNGTGPFYMWSNDHVHDEIQQLFAGKKIYLLADVMQTGKLNAVKFNAIHVEFHSNNETINEQLEGILQSFHVFLTHMGESDYRCDDQFYTISSRMQTMEYNFAKRNQVLNDGNAIFNQSMMDIKMLSPYTLWAIQLTRGQFDQLKPFVNSVDIELHGHGQYVEEGATICDTDLDKYYSPLPARPQISIVPQHLTGSAAHQLMTTSTHSCVIFVALILIPSLVSQ